MNRNKYSRFSVLIRGGIKGSFSIDVVAIDHEAMLADIAQAYENAEVITWTQYPNVSVGGAY